MISEGHYEIHPMFARAAAIIVKTSPRPGRKIHFWKYVSRIWYRQPLMRTLIARKTEHRIRIKG